MESIGSIEVDLIDACNLSCPMCNRSRFISKEKYKDLEYWKNKISEYKNLKNIYFIGTRSESTLYPYFLELCEWIKNRNIRVVISTNGCTNKTSFWESLGGIMTEGDELRFCVDGSNQEIYEKYRVGGNLERLLNNHKAFIKNNKNKNDVIQTIRFKHNEEDDFEKIRKKFSKVRELNSSFYHQSDDVKARDSDVKKFQVVNNLSKTRKKDISCVTKNKEHFINYNGDVYPCCHYNEFAIENNLKWDGSYTEIENGEFDFCTIICDKSCVKLMRALDLEL